MQQFYDAFISYGRVDSKAFAARLHRRLTEYGLNVWFDFEDIPLGVDYQKQIDDGIERTDNFLFIISPHSVNSPHCHLEIELALRYQKRIIPLLHVERISYDTWRQRNPNGTAQEWAEYQTKGLHDYFQNMHPVLQKINWVYMREGQDDFEAAFTGLLNIFDRHRDYVHQHTLLLAKALEWQQNQKRSPYLLIGEERLQAEEWLKVRFTDAQPPCSPTDLHCEFIAESRKNANNLMTDVFLAYADMDRATAVQICNSLRREGLTVWTNTTDIQAGAAFQQIIDRGIEEADNVVYLLSSAAIQSRWCQHELDYALSLNKRIIPVLLEAVAPHQIPTSLRNLQYIDLTDNVQATDYQQDESQLLRILRQDAAYHETHKLLLTKALKWERQQQNPTLLLRGYNLRHAEAWLKMAKQSAVYPVLPLQETFVTESLRQPPGISLDVFISYSRVDSGFARKLNDALQSHGKRTWFDQESIAAGTVDFQQEIYKGIESSDTFLFVLSPRSVTSPYCADEVEYAARLNKRFVTLLHQPIDPSTLHPELAKVQWLDFNQREGDFSANFTELLRILDTDTEHLHAHTRLLMRAIEWDSKGRKESLLLRGDDLEQAEQWLAQSVGKEPKPTELQQSYVATSRTVEEAQNRATQILQAAAKKGEQAEQKLQEAERSLQEATAKGRRRLLIGTIAGAIGLVIAGVAGFAAVRAETKIRMAEVRLQTTASNEKFLSGQAFQGLLLALQSGQTMRTQFQSGSSEREVLQSFIVAVLQQAVNGVSEMNTLPGYRGRGIRLSPDGKTLAFGSYDNTIKLWNMETGQEIGTFEGHQAGVSVAHFSPDGKTLASGSFDNTIKLWNVETGQEIVTFEGHQAGVNSISFSPDGRTLASGSGDNTVKLWNVETGQEIHTLQGHQDVVFSISFSPDGKTLASGSADNTIKLWNVETGQEIRTLQGYQGEVRNVSFSPDGKTLASLGSADITIKLQNLETGEIRTLQGHQDLVTHISFSPDGKTLASGSFDSTIKLWNVATGRDIRTLRGHQGLITSVNFSPDGRVLLSGSADNTIKLWNVATSGEVSTLRGHQNGVTSISFSSDGKTLASGSYDSTIKLWNMETGEGIRTIQGVGWGGNISFSPDGKTLASSGSDDHTTKLWNVETGTEIHSLPGHEAWVSSISFKPDGKILASGSYDSTIKLWNVETGQEIRTLKGHQNQVWHISFSPNGKTLASSSIDNSIKLWNVETGQEIRTFQEVGWVGSISFSPDGKTLASGGDDIIKLWDVETGTEILTIRGANGVNSLSFSPDGKTLASGSGDETVKVWDAATGRLLHTLEGHQDVVTSISFSPDGKTIASASGDGTIKLWIWDFDRLMTMGCDWIQQYLSTRPDERYLCDGYLPPNE
ncbi:TIR domain-containing protein [Oscillatoria sp. FACHB-1407]|uniref:TIR domain-containing protein n=1 Tax=Oscillatoria sp. FACHB-1407 TaxID=2692847 RepID=UPI0016827EC0|nr:TIR domain-containing protein [Oscillatoria sp. FACHB-1407]MBD2460597.1 TIR domain-containing protein [Oscillatoria sp. FACHB-1407]